MYNPSVSIVVNTYNRAKSLEATLSGLSHLQYDPYEIIVVNGPSSDATDLVLAKWRSRVKVASCAEANLAISRNIGIAASSGDIVAFIDDDAVPHPQWIARLASKYGDSLVGGVGGYTIDNTGVRFQCCKTIADRFGNAYYPPAFFDERPLNSPGTPMFPTLLGTNSSFRRSALEKIGGFDHTFAYLLDETDVCLRIVDAGYQILYDAAALVFHQFAPSHIRSYERVARTLFPSAVSKAYFVVRHGARQSLEEAGIHLARYRADTLKSNHGLTENGFISREHCSSLDQDLVRGIEIGTEKGHQTSPSRKGDLQVQVDRYADDFKPFSSQKKMCIALVTQGFPPSNDAGIARWTWLVARGLAERGHAVHVISRAETQPFTRFEDGFWQHARADDALLGEALMAEIKVPLPIASRAAAVRSAVEYVKSFGLDVISFPIWDVEGIACLNDTSVAIVMSLHTSYSLAKPHKKEWNLRPLQEHFAVDSVIRAESALLRQIPTIVANSRAIIADLSNAHGVQFADRVTLVPHGTLDPYMSNPQRSTRRDFNAEPFRILFVGRFELRKGFDIAARVFSAIIRSENNVLIDIIGEELTAATTRWLKQLGADNLIGDHRVRFHGVVNRAELDDFYAETHVVLMPSRYESFGMVAVEAMAAGAPVVVLDVGGSPEVVEHDVSGHIVPSNGEEVETIRGFLRTMMHCGKLRERLSRGARETFERHFTFEKMIDGIESVYWNAHLKARTPHAT